MAKQHALPYNFRASLTALPAYFIVHRLIFQTLWHGSTEMHTHREIIDRSNRSTIRSPLETLLIPSITPLPPTPSPWKPYDNWIETNSTIAICFRGRKLLFEIGEKGWNQLWIVARVIHSESFTVFMANCVGCVLTFRVTLLQLHVVQETW